MADDQAARAIHESGHCLAALVLGLRVESMNIRNGSGECVVLYPADPRTDPRWPAVEAAGDALLVLVGALLERGALSGAQIRDLLAGNPVARPASRIADSPAV